MTEFEIGHVIAEFCFVGALMIVGEWLENIGEKDGFFDELFAPVPMGLSGLWMVFIERL